MNWLDKDSSQIKKFVTKVFQDRNLYIRDYQLDIFTDLEFLQSDKPSVIAAGTSAGKTLTICALLELFYSYAENKDEVTIICPSVTKILRTNFEEKLTEFKSKTFKFAVLMPKTIVGKTIKQQYQEYYKNGVRVFVVLPQTMNANYMDMPKVHNFIMDEAHLWYKVKSTKTKVGMIDKIKSHIKPKKEFLLTGTPSIFHRNRDAYIFKYISVYELYNLGFVTDVKTEMLLCSYDFNSADFYQSGSSAGDLREGKAVNKKENMSCMEEVIDQLIKLLKIPSLLKGQRSFNNLTGKALAVLNLFNKLQKTIVFCRNIEQANAFGKVFNNYSVPCVVSHSINDNDSAAFQEFKKNPEMRVMVLVNRGREGFDMSDLNHIVDFTMTQNLDTNLQMLGRLLRENKQVKKKIYYKVATRHTIEYFCDIMTAVMALWDRKYYEQFDGRNFDLLKIPRIYIGGTKPRKKSGKKSVGGKKKGKPVFTPQYMLQIPLELSIWSNPIVNPFTCKDSLKQYKFTTLEQARKQFFGITHKTLEEWYRFCEDKWLSKNKLIPSIKELRNMNLSALAQSIQANPKLYIGKIDKKVKTHEEHVEFAVNNWIKYGKKIPKVPELQRLGYYALIRSMRIRPELYEKYSDKRKNLSDWLKYVDEKWLSKNQLIPNCAWLVENGYESLYAMIRKYPQSFDGKLEKLNRKTPHEWLEYAKINFKNKIPSKSFLIKNKLSGLYRAIYKHPEIFKGLI